MSSTRSAIAQRLTKKLVTLTNQNNSRANETAFFLDSDFDTWYSGNTSVVSKVGNLYVVNDGINPDTVMRGTGPYTELVHSGTGIDSNISLTDMGKDIRIGSSTRSDYVVFRRVQVPGTLAKIGGNGTVGYVVVERNMSDITLPRFQVNVARV